MRGRKILGIVVLTMALWTLCGCMPVARTGVQDHAAGFFAGIWHGWIAPFTLLYSLLDKGVGIYEANNNGFPYNLGYYMAIISGFGSLALIRGKKKGKN